MGNTILKQLEKREEEIREEILKHDFFKIRREKAIKFLISRLETSIMISNGNLFSLPQSPNDDLLMSGHKLVEVIQTSIPFIFYNLHEKHQVDNLQIDVVDLIKLIQQVCDYLEFKKMIRLYKMQIVRVIFNDQVIRFEYKDDVFRINDIYNGYWHSKEQNVVLEDAESLEDITEKIFDLTVDINIGQFSMEDYKLFCKGIDFFILTEYINPVMIVNDIGYIELEKNKWINQLSYFITDLSSEKIKSIVEFLTYNFEDINGDPLLSYFIPTNGKLLLSISMFSSQRLDKNLLRLLLQKNEAHFQNEQKKLEKHQINELRLQKSSMYDFDTDKDGSPGEDLIVYDKKANIVHVIELKFKLPVDSIKELRSLKRMLAKASTQNEKAKKAITLDNIFEKYFNGKYEGKKPKEILYFTLTNYSVYYDSNCRILLTQHYAELLKSDNCSERLKKIFNDPFRGINMKPNVKFEKINLFGNVIKIPLNYSETPYLQELKY
ncbi:hypothetical protein AB3329_06515 [Streptococcus sp. H31]|uniref:hypothetical protein n=1 Tax=Streptococcus huangxiaojuni TaxID=3237239 RepID=UPI0034A33BFD